MTRRKRKRKPDKRKGRDAQEHPQPDAPSPASATPATTISQPPAKIVESRKANQSANEKRGKKMTPWERRVFGWGQLLLAAAIAAATVAQVYVSKRQWDAMEISAGQTQQSLELMKAEQRALITLDNFTISGMEPEKTAKVQITIRNIGRTLATVEMCNINRFVGGFDKHGEPNLAYLFANAFQHLILNKMPKQQVKLVPNETHQFGYESKVVTSENFDAMASGKDVHRFVVMVFYKDALGDPKFSQFMLRYDPKSKALVRETIENYME